MNEQHEMRFDLGERMPSRLRRQTSRLLGMTAAQASRTAQRALGAVGAHKWHFAVLAALDEFGPSSQAGLADRTGIFRSDMVATLNALAEAGFIERAPDPADKRRNIITITAAGAARLNELDAVTAEANERILAPLDQDERDRLFDLLGRVNAHLAGREG